MRFMCRMHTATRADLGTAGAELGGANPWQFGAYGLYAPLAARKLASLAGVESLFGRRVLTGAGGLRSIFRFRHFRKIHPALIKNVFAERLPLCDPDRSDLHRSDTRLLMPLGSNRLVVLRKRSARV